MGLHYEYDENQLFNEYEQEEDPIALQHRREIRRCLDERLERKRLKAELEDEFDNDFDWSNFE